MHTCQVTRFRRVIPGNRVCHPHFPEHPSGHGFHYDDPESPGIGPDIRNIYLFIYSENTGILPLFTNCLQCLLTEGNDTLNSISMRMLCLLNIFDRVISMYHWQDLRPLK